MKWRDVEALLLEHYETGTSNEGAEITQQAMFCVYAVKSLQTG